MIIIDDLTVHRARSNHIYEKVGATCDILWHFQGEESVESWSLFKVNKGAMGGLGSKGIQKSDDHLISFLCVCVDFLCCSNPSLMISHDISWYLMISHDFPCGVILWIFTASTFIAILVWHSLLQYTSPLICLEFAPKILGLLCAVVHWSDTCISETGTVDIQENWSTLII